MLLNPVMPVAPVTVIFEKLLFDIVTLALVGEEPFVVVNVTVPPAPVLLNAVTIELLLMVFVPLAGIVKLCDMKVKLPVVFVDILVKLLLLIEVVRLVLAILIAMIAAVAETEWFNLVKLLLLILTTLVVLAEPDG